MYTHRITLHLYNYTYNLANTPPVTNNYILYKKIAIKQTILYTLLRCPNTFIKYQDNRIDVYVRKWLRLIILHNIQRYYNISIFECVCGRWLELWKWPEYSRDRKDIYFGNESTAVRRKKLIWDIKIFIFML